jgi:hypothetical protein
MRNVHGGAIDEITERPASAAFLPDVRTPRVMMRVDLKRKAMEEWA